MTEEQELPRAEPKERAWSMAAAVTFEPAGSSEPMWTFRDSE